MDKIDALLTNLGIPQDMIDAANKVEMDAETLVKLTIAHSKEAVADVLNFFVGKLGK